MGKIGLEVRPYEPRFCGACDQPIPPGAIVVHIRGVKGVCCEHCFGAMIGGA